MPNRKNKTPETFEGLAHRVEKLHEALLGDDYGNEGYLHRIDRLERMLEETKELSRENTKKIEKLWQYAISAGIILSVVFEIITRLINIVD